MCHWEALERPNFLKLQFVFENNFDMLETNMDNEEYVDNLFERAQKEVMDVKQGEQKEFIDEPDDDNEEEPIQFTEQIKEKKDNDDRTFEDRISEYRK